MEKNNEQLVDALFSLSNEHNEKIKKKKINSGTFKKYLDHLAIMYFIKDMKLENNDKVKKIKKNKRRVEKIICNHFIRIVVSKIYSYFESIANRMLSYIEEKSLLLA